MTASRCLIAGLALTAGCGRLGFGLGGDDTRDAAGDAIVGDGSDAALVDCHVTHPGAMFCDGFESTSMMPEWGYTTLMNGTADRTTARAYRGTASLDAETDASASYKSARWGHFYAGPLTSGDLYVRAYYWLSSATVVTDQLGILVTGNGVSPFPASYIVLAPGQVFLLADGISYSFVGDFPRDRWVCVELHVLIDPTNGYVEAAFDGTTYRTPNTDTDVAGGYTNLDIGIHYATTTQGAASLWADEVVMDTAPIGCN